MDSIFNTASKIEISAIILAINNDIGKIVEKHLIPHFEEMLSAKHNMKLIETVLRQMPDFKRLEQENETMRRELDIKSVQSPVPVHNCPPTTILMCPYHNTFLAPVPAAPVPAAQENLIKLEIVEKAPKTENVISEKDIYSDVNLTTPLNNTQVSAGELDEDEAEVEDETEEEASEAEEEEASEAEEEASEAEASEVEEEEASEVEEVDTLEEEEASEAEEEAEEEEEEASEAEEEAEEEEESGVEGGDPLEEEEEESGVEGGDPLEEEEEESGVEGGDPLEEEADPLEADEVFLVEIKGRGKFYTNNETNGDIYAIEGEDDVGEEVGKFVNKVATFF